MGIEDPIVSIFVDNIIIIRVKESKVIKQVKRKLAAAFNIVDISHISFYFGLKIEKNCIIKILKLFQPAYIDKILAKYHLNQAKLSNIPMKKGILLPSKGSEVKQTEQEKHQRMTGSLMFSIVEIRLNIAFAISVVSWFAKNPSYQYIEVVKTIIRYLKATRLVGIIYDGEERGGKDFIIKEFSDSDYASNYAIRKSTSSFIFMLNGGLVSWYAKKQKNSSLIINKDQIRSLNACGKRSNLAETATHQNRLAQGIRLICRDWSHLRKHWDRANPGQYQRLRGGSNTINGFIL